MAFFSSHCICFALFFAAWRAGAVFVVSRADCFWGRASYAQFCFSFNTRNFTISFDHLAWNIVSTSFDLNLDPPKSECSLILYSYKYFDIILLLVLASYFCFE
jgi:hypothetical protein